MLNGQGSPGFFSSLGQFTKIKLPNGLVGKITTLLIIMVICLSTIAIKINNTWIIILIIIIIPLSCIPIVLKLISFADKNPQAALLEGGQFIMHEQIQLASKKDGIISFNPDKQVFGTDINFSEKDLKQAEKPDQVVDIGVQYE